MPRVNPEKLTTVKIEVTDRLIKTGTVNDSESCPFALAVKKVVRKNVEVVADYELIGLLDDGAPDCQEIVTPARVSKFMEKIDARETDPYAIDDGDEIPAKLPPLPKAFAINLKIQNKFLRPSLRK
jgi:hypothetical protein